jgi:hypothetical protein
MNKKNTFMKSVKKYLSALMLFFVLLMLNNCGGGGGGGSNSSVLDMMSANDVKVTSLNNQTGLILSDVFVSIAEIGKEQVVLKSANTGDSGVFVFSKIKIGSYIVKASRSGYETATVNVVVTNGPQDINVRLKPSYPPDSISGLVKRSDTLEGVSDVTVEIKDSSPIIKTLTDKTGNYVLSNVQPTGTGSAPYVIKASKPGFQPAERANVIKLPNIALKEVDITLQSSGSAEIMLPGKIIGVVKNRVTSDPVENISVTLQDSGLPSDYSRATGYYHIENVSAGKTYILTAIETTSAKKYKAYSQQILLTSQQTLVQDILMDPVEAVPAMEFGWLIGTVLDSVSKAAIAGVSVELLGTSLYDITVANGSFKINKITPETEYIMLFSKSGYVSQTSKRTIAKNQNNMDPIELVPSSSSQNYCSIIGVVRDKDTKVTVAGVNVEIAVPDTNSVTFTKVSTTTGSSGAFVFEKVFIPNDKVETGQTMTMVIGRSDYVSLTIQIEVKGGKVNQISELSTEVTKLKGTIMGTVVDADTNIPIAGANVALANFTYPGISNPITSGAGNGFFQFSNIPVGTYTLMVSANEYATEVKNGITLTYNGQTIGPLSIQLKKDFGTITGFVYLETNGTKGYQSGSGGDTPLSGISVIAAASGGGSTPGGELGSDLSKSDGSYALKNLPISNISIISNSGTGANANYSSYTESYSVTKGFQTFNIELAQTKGNISGVIYEDLNKNGAFDNEPLVSGAVVSVTQSGTTMSSTTDALGNFILTGLNFGTLNINAAKTNYKESAKTVTLAPNSSLSNVYIGLYKPTGKLTGRVIDFNTPDPKQGISGVSVKILGFSNLTAITDSTGGYFFNDVLANNGGIAQYTIVGDGSALGYGVATKQADAPVEGAIANAPDIELSKASRLVYGKIVDSVTNAGIASIKVKIQGTAYEATTDNSGVYVFDAIPVNTAANYTLGISDTITINGSSRYQTRDDVSISVNNESTPLKIQNIPITPNTGKIRGTVYDSITGFPIKSSLFTDPIQAELAISGLASPVTTAVSQVNGEFLLENIPSGSYNLKVRHAVSGTNPKMFEEVSRNALVTAGQTTDLGIIYITLKTMTIRGRVRDKIVNDKVGVISGLSDYYISGAVVQASINGIPYTKTATTSYDGSYQMTVPVYSDYKFKAGATNYIDNEIGSSEVTLSTTILAHTQNFNLDPRVGNISSTVFLDSNNNGYYDVGDTAKIKDAHPKYMLGDFRVKTNYRGVTFSVSVESNSTFMFTNLPVGSYYLTIDPPAANLDPAYAELNSTSWLEGPSGNRIINVNNSSTTVINGTVITKTTYPTGSISGNIVDTETLSPLAGATIKVSAGLNNQNITTTADASGFFNLTNLVYYKDETDTTEVFTLNITRDSYITIQRNYVMANTPNASREITIYEKMSKVTGSISGRVKDSQNNLPLINVRVSIIGQNIPSVTTNDDGSFLFDNNVPANTYSLYFTKLNAALQPDPTYSTYTASGVQVTNNLIKNIDDVFLSTNFSSLSGVVYLETNNISGYQAGQDKPLPDINIFLTPVGGTVSATPDFTTAADGKYLFNNVQLGNYNLTFSTTASEGYYSLPVAVSLPNKTAVVKDVQMQAKNGDLYGVIFFDENNNGIKDGAEQGITGIDITPASTFGTFTAFRTGVGGEYEFKNMSPVTGKITVDNGNNIKTYKKKEFFQTIIAGQRTKLDIAMYRNTVVIRGKVIDSDSNPISGINISINGTSHSTTSGADGRYTLSGVEIGSGTTTFVINYEAITLGYKTQTVTSPGTTGDDITMDDITMNRSTRNVRGKVVNAGLLPLSNVTVKIIGEVSVPSVTTDSFGYFTLTTVPVDLVNQKQLEISATDYEIAFRNFTLGTGTTTYFLSPDIQLTSSLAEISGTVLDELTGGPVSSPNFSVSINLTNNTVLYTTTAGADGKFKLKNIPKGGPYDLSVQSSTGSNEFFNDTLRTVTLTAGQKYDIGTLYIRLKTIAVKGTVFDSKVYDLALTANSLSRAGVSSATVTAKYKRNDGTYYQVVSSPTLSSGSFEIELPSLRFDFSVARSNYIAQSFPGTNINTYPNSYNGLDFRIKPQSVTAYGKAYYDKNANSYVDTGDEPIFTADGGVFQNLVNTLIVSYDYHSFTFDTFVLSDSSFVIPDLPIAPDGAKRFTIYDRFLGNNIAPSPWFDSTLNNVVTVNSGGTNPAIINIAVTPTESQYALINGKVYDYKMAVEGVNLYNIQNKDSINSQITNAKIQVTTLTGFNKTYDAQPDGRYLIKLPASTRYDLRFYADGYTETREVAMLQAPGTIYNFDSYLYPKFGSVTGTIYYDNNLNAVNSEPTDYNHLREASEPTVNSVTGHPTVSSNWGGATFNVMYGYRGLTFGTTAYNRTNSQYEIQKVPVGTYNNFVVQDVTSLTNWTGVGNDYSQRMFMSQIYTLDGKTPASVTVTENAASANINFAVMVWGGHITGIRVLENGTDFSVGEFERGATAPSPRAKMRGEDYWLALGGPLDKTDGLNLPRRYYLELFDLRDGGGSSGIKPLKFSDAQGVIRIMSYPVGADPDIIVPPGNYVLSVAGDVDLSGSPTVGIMVGLNEWVPNSDYMWATWYTSSTGFLYKYGSNATMGGTEATAKDRCQQNIHYYQGSGASGVEIKAGQTHIITN